MAALNFTTPERDNDRPTELFTWDGREMEATCPKQSVWADLSAAQDPDATDTEQYRAVKAFIDSALTPNDRKWFRDRSKNQDDAFEYNDLVRLLAALLDCWSDYMIEQSHQTGTHDTVKKPGDRPRATSKRAAARTPGKRAAKAVR